jgi:hypothetical protein
MDKPKLNEARLSNLCGLLTAAKAMEAFAKQKRTEAEAEIATMIPLEGATQKTVALPSGVKILVKGGVNYSADTSAIRSAFEGLRVAGVVTEESQIIPPVTRKVSESLDVSGYEWLKTNRPDIFAAICGSVTVTPKKAAVTVTAP